MPDGLLTDFLSSLPISVHGLLSIAILLVIATALRFVFSWLISGIAKRG